MGIISLVEHFQMGMGEAMSTVSEGERKGISKYQRVVAEALQKQISLSQAEVHVQAGLGQHAALAQLEDARRTRMLHRKVQRLSACLSISHEEAHQLIADANTGNEEACAQIRQARRTQMSQGNATL